MPKSKVLMEPLRIAQEVYSFLSHKGSHKYDAERASVYNTETSLKETCSLAEMLLEKLSDYRECKEKPART